MKINDKNAYYIMILFRNLYKSQSKTDDIIIK